MSLFRIVAVAEVISYLLLLVVAVPLKYFADEPAGVRILGPIHGILFVLYILLVVRRSSVERWSFRRTAYALVAGILPLGPLRVSAVAPEGATTPTGH